MSYCLSVQSSGAFLGYLAAIITFFVWSLIKEGLGNPKQLAVPALILLSWFGIGLAGLTGIVFQIWPMFLGAIITFTHGARFGDVRNAAERGCQATTRRKQYAS